MLRINGQQAMMHKAVARASTVRTFTVSAKAMSNPRSPLQIFRETFKQEWEKSKELQDNIKASFTGCFW